MGKSSGSSGGGGGQQSGSQTVTQDIAEPFKGFIVRSLQRAQDLQGLPSLPFTGVGTAGPTPDELVGSQALRNRFMEHQPLTEQAIALQTTAADPITSQGILARQNPFQAQIAQEAYRRLDENTQRDLQDQRAREVNSGGFRARGAIEDDLLRRRQDDQERQIGLEAGNRAFKEASELAVLDRAARGATAAGINQRLQERQNLGRVDIDDLLRVGAQQRETFIQPEINLERQQFEEQRGPGSVQNPFGFEQFFSGIRSAAPSPTVQTQTQFQQPRSGLATAANVIGGGLQTANNFGAFNSAPATRAEGGIVNFDTGGIAQFAQGQAATLEEKRAIQGEIARLSEFFASFERNPGRATPEQIQGMKDVARALRENRNEMDLPSLEALTDEVNRLYSASQKETLVTDAEADQGGRGDGLLGSGIKPRGMLTEEGTRGRAADLERRAAEFEKRRSSPPVEKSEVVWQYPGYWKTSETEPSLPDSVAIETQPPTPNPPTPGAADFDAGYTTGMAPPKYSDAEITAMMTFSSTGRGREGLPDELKGLNTLEVQQALQPIRERAAESSKARREKERRDRISNRSGFRNSGSSPGASYEFSIQDVKDLFDFKDGGIASFKKGGFADMVNPMALWNQGDPVTNMVLDAVGMPELKKYGQSAYMFGGMDDDPSKDPGGHGAWSEEEEEEEMSPQEYVELWQENQRRNQRKEQTDSSLKRAKAKSGLTSNLREGGIASFKNGREVEVQKEMKKTLGRYNPTLMYGYNAKSKADRDVALGRIPGYPSRTKELTDVAEDMINYDYEFENVPKAKAAEVEKARKKVAVALAEPDTSPASEEIKEVPYLEQIMKTYMDSLKASETEGYPSKRRLNSEQQKSGAINALAAALMSVRSDETGRADFSRMGSAAAASSSQTLADLEAARKEEVATRTARSSSILTGLMANTKMAQEMSEAQLNSVNAALKQQELLHPEWRVEKIALEALLPLRVDGRLTAEQFAKIMLELTDGQNQKGSGLNMPGQENVDAALEAALN